MAHVAEVARAREAQRRQQQQLQQRQQQEGQQEGDAGARAPAREQQRGWAASADQSPPPPQPRFAGWGGAISDDEVEDGGSQRVGQSRAPAGAERRSPPPAGRLGITRLGSDMEDGESSSDGESASDADATGEPGVVAAAAAAEAAPAPAARKRRSSAKRAEQQQEAGGAVEAAQEPAEAPSRTQAMLEVRKTRARSKAAASDGQPTGALNWRCFSLHLLALAAAGVAVWGTLLPSVCACKRRRGSSGSGGAGIPQAPLQQGRRQRHQ